MGHLIYIADDEPNILELLKAFLESDGYEVSVFQTGEDLINTFKQKNSDLVILDIMMPGKDGLTCCQELRKITNVPIIILTARDSELDYVHGITLGSDDYLTKPFRPTILLMRVKALLRRMDMNSPDSEINRNLIFGDISFNSEENIIYCRKSELHLTNLEKKVLTYMMLKPEKSYSREELLENIWGYSDSVESRVVDELLRRIRKKLSSASSAVYIETIWGYGYRIKQEK